jgi:hypothetical protein
MATFLRHNQRDHARLVMKKQAGSTVVEFALVLIVFLTFFLGITISRASCSPGARPTKHRAMEPGSRQSAMTLPTRPRFWRE